MSETTKRKKLGLPEKIVIGLGLGIAGGLFFGELTAPLKYVGDAFVGLLQMTVLPYIMVALIGGIGKLTARQSKQLLGRVALVILFLWFIGYLAVFLFSMSLPLQTSASFFSSSLVEQPKSFDFFSLFIPSNPFQSMAENRVPAVVLFSLLCGAAIIGMRIKDRIISVTETMQDVLGVVTGFIVRLSPIGVFCIAASAAGTMNLAELARIQGYLVLMTLFILAICFLLVPALVTSFTPLKSKDISPLLRASFVLAFATGKTLIVLPMLIEGIREIFEKQARENEQQNKDVDSTIEVLVPLSYAFPHLGRILSTAFIPFAGWYIGQPLPLDVYPLLFGAGVFVHFSTATVSMPFLLDLARLPGDLFQLFMVVGVYMSRLADAAGAAHILAVTVLGTCAINGTLKVSWRKVGALVASVVVVSLVLVVGSRFYLDFTSTNEYNKDKVIAAMQLPRNAMAAEVVEPGASPVPLTQGQSRLERILERGVIRVGFVPDHLPFSYYNQSGETVGFDLEMINQLARDLDVTLELVPISDRTRVAEDLRNDYFDIAVGGFIDTVDLSRRSPFSEPYLYLNMALIVRDHRDGDFASPEMIRAVEGLRIGVIRGGGFSSQVRAFFPNADIVELASPREFFEGGEAVADALYFSAESGSAWTMLYPSYQIVTSLPHAVKLPVVIPYAGEPDAALDEFMDNWVMLKRNDGTLDAAYDYWILGKGTEQSEPRWSVIRNVLGWVD
jgi:Na+/H+-dicarboxylate symporter